MISVIIPLYNKEASIEQTLRSVFSQDYDDFEVVIVDDGSTDNSVQIVRSYIKQCLNDNNEQSSYDNLQVSTNGSNENKRCLYDNDNTASQTITARAQHSSLIPHPSSLITYPSSRSILLIEQENGGPSKARNTGVKHARGEWIVFLDADDELMPGALRRFADGIKKSPESDFFACPFLAKKESSISLQYPYQEGVLEEPFKEHFYGRFLPRTGAFICRKELLLKNLFCAQIRRFEDLEMLFRLYKEAKIFLLPELSMTVNQEYAEASRGRKDISEDFVGHLDFHGKSFWEKMCLYQLYLGERPLYPEQLRKLYPGLDKRYDLLLLAKLLKR